MSFKTKNNIIWIDFRSKRTYDLSKLGHSDKFSQPIPYLCRPKTNKLASPAANSTEAKKSKLKVLELTIKGSTNHE